MPRQPRRRALAGRDAGIGQLADGAIVTPLSPTGGIMFAMRAVSTGLAALLAIAAIGVPAAAQSEPGPSPQPSASPLAEIAEIAEVAEPADGAVFIEPRWEAITPAHGPAAREDHTWTVDAGGRYAYLFGGRDGRKTFGDLWRFDLETDTWELILPRSRKPAPRFGHNAVWVDGLGLAVFAGQRGEDFFNDLWAFDPEAGNWRKLPARGSTPRPRYGSCMIVGPDGRLWISHGFTTAGRFDDTRAYNLKTRRWSSIAPAARRPGERCLHECFTAANGELVLYGGQDDGTFALGDLWVTLPNGKWKRETDPQPRARRLYAVTEAGRHAWIFGGAGEGNDPLDDLWRVDRETLEFTRVRVESRAPSARYAGTLITDAARGRLLLFGGQGRQAMADVWQLSGELVSLGELPEPEAEDDAPQVLGRLPVTPTAEPDSEGV